MGGDLSTRLIQDAVRAAIDVRDFMHRYAERRCDGKPVFGFAYVFTPVQWLQVLSV